MANGGEVRIKVRADTGSFEASIRRVNRRVGVATERMRRAFDRVSGSIRRMGPGLARAGVAATAAGAAFGALAVRALGAVETIDDLSRRANVSAEFLQEMRFAASQSGASTRDFDDAISRLNRRLGLFIETGMSPAKQAFERLGLASRITSGELSTAESVFEASITALEGIDNAASRAALASQLFGEDAGPRLATLMAQGTEGINALRESARDLGIVLENDLVTQGAAASDALERVGMQFTAETNRAISENAEAIVSLGEALTGIASLAIQAGAGFGMFLDEIFGANARVMPASLEALGAYRTELDGLQQEINLFGFGRGHGIAGRFEEMDRELQQIFGTEQFAAILRAAQDRGEEAGAAFSAALGLKLEAIDARLTLLRTRPPGGDNGGNGGELQRTLEMAEANKLLAQETYNVARALENKLKLSNDTAEAMAESTEALNRFAVDAQSAGDMVTGAISNSFDKMARGIKVTFRDLAQEILAIFARIAFNNLIAQPVANFATSLFSGGAGALLGTASGAGAAAFGNAAAAAPGSKGGASQTIINIDAKYASQGTAEMIVQKIQEAAPQLIQQSSNVAVQTMNQTQRNRSAF